MQPERLTADEVRCARCGKPATGYASINDDRLCHGDDDASPTCYERVTWALSFMTQSDGVEIVGEGRERYGIVPKGRAIHPARNDGPACR